MKTEKTGKLVDILLRHRVRDRQKMLQAARRIDKLRHSEKNWNSVEVIRKFRGPI